MFDREKWSKHAETNPDVVRTVDKKNILLCVYIYIYNYLGERDIGEKKSWPETRACCSDFAIKDLADVMILNSVR